MATIDRPRPNCSEEEYRAWILQPRGEGTMQERSFFNGRTLREEARLYKDSAGYWRVWDTASGGEGWQYQANDHGYAAALADYESRIARLQITER